MKQGLFIPVVLVAAMAAGATTPAWADPPPWAPAHGYRAKHSYVYYPQHRIYYEPESRVWFWFGDGRWQVGVELPVYYRQYTYGGVSVELDTDHPYEYDSKLYETYGGRGGKHGHGGRHGHDDEDD